MEYYTDLTHNGTKVTCSIDPDKPEAVVEYGGTIRFVFNPDFPHDAKAFFDALCLVREAMTDETHVADAQ